MKRKADKSVCRSNIWTAEELDYAKAQGRELSEQMKRCFEDDVPPRKPRSDRMAVGE